MEEEGGVSGVAVGVVDRQGWEREKGGGEEGQGTGEGRREGMGKHGPSSMRTRLR